jgi:GTPase
MARLYSEPVREHGEVPLADEGQWERLVERWEERAGDSTSGSSGHVPASRREAKADYVVSVGAEEDPEIRRAKLAEIVSLVKNQGDRVVGSECLHLAEAHPRALLGKGTAEAVAARARAAGAQMLVLDAELTPSQARNLEDTAKIAICDREAIILNVFLRHARTRRARVQVELAQLEYVRPRIRGVGLDMDQQTGGMPGARGPGETASELLARKIDDRIFELKKALRKLATSEATQRSRRASCRRLVLVGYTNAGKTSLMNALTGAVLSVQDRPFETLDTTSRCLTRHGGDVLVSDTVGFIRRLPDALLASFQSTLDEVREASGLVVVVDASDPERELHAATTRRVLAQLGAGDIPASYVFNKVDRLTTPADDASWERLADGAPWTALSSHDAGAVAALRQTLIRAARSAEARATFWVPYGANDVLSLLYAQCRVVESEAHAECVRLAVEGSPAALARVRAALTRGRR